MVGGIIDYLLSLPKSIYFCMKCLPVKQAVKIPVFVRYNTKLASCKGRLFLSDNIAWGGVKIGFGTVPVFDKKCQRTILHLDGKIIIKGKCLIGHGSRILVDRKGVLELGDKFHITANSTIMAFKKVRFGSDVLISWDVLLMDNDLHHIYSDLSMQSSETEQEICIGNHVWIGCRSTLLKGCVVNDNSVIAANSVVTRKSCLIDTGNHNVSILLAGNPAKIIKKGVNWEK